MSPPICVHLKLWMDTRTSPGEGYTFPRPLSDLCLLTSNYIDLCRPRYATLTRHVQSTTPVASDTKLSVPYGPRSYSKGVETRGDDGDRGLHLEVVQDYDRPHADDTRWNGHGSKIGSSVPSVTPP